ncbi:MAG: hypothetical protein E5Y88_20420 [Mesorhizobium sp.]|uniref:hypothetical protein n=1 Tax=Mesorhizobium sp. TaxID=1871066 RepID=UPI0011F81BCD|nr:hypothetical protein [Mesorhizobium sp.]TIL23900.1 MAG: hypothetical protein E5Y88_20420 [Mesorhizobium sp.]
MTFLPQYKGKLLVVTSPTLAGSDKKEQTRMTFPTPILVSAFVLAGAALLTLRSAAFAATRRSMIKVRSNRRRPASSVKSNPGL